MSHLGQDAMRRILGEPCGSQEIEEAVEHIVSCEPCRARAASLIEELRAERPGLRGEGSLQLVFDLADRERKRGVESLAAVTEWAELRRASRKAQRDRVRMAKTCHTIAFLNLVLGEIQQASSWEEAEFLAGLALLSIEGMSQRQQITLAYGKDLQAQVWIKIANARRLAAEWKRAHQALSNAERHWKEGTGDPLLEAGLLSIAASTLSDEGKMPQAFEALERCRAIYEGRAEWALLARALVQMANLWVESAPEKGLAALDRAAPWIPAEDSQLRVLAELLRVRLLIDLGKPTEALQVYRRCSRLLIASPSTRIRIRGRFTAAQLLDALGLNQQADRLFNEVVDSNVEHELYKDAFLDLLYLYGRHVRAGNLEKAVRVCRRALTDSSLGAVAHEQLREVWSQLLEAAQAQAVSAEVLKEVRLYLSAHWKNPAVRPPVVVG
jgi:tetratricopeptide (TPR) repeat protein